MSSEQVVNVKYKTILYSTDLEAIKNVLNEILKLKKVKYLRLKAAKKTHVIRKGPCGRGYAVYIKKTLKIHRWVIFFSNMTQFKTVTSAIKTPNVYMESSLC